MPRRREGQLVWRQSGWHARITTIMDGELVRRMVSLGTAYKPAARRKLKRLVAQVENGGAPPIGDSVTLDDFAEAWLAKRGEQGKRSVATERVLYESYWRAPLGSLPVGEVTQAKVHAVLHNLGTGHMHGVRGKRLSRQSIRHVHGVLLRIFRSAVSAQVVKHNPVAAIELTDVLPRADKRPRTVPTDDELRMLLSDSGADLEMKTLVLLSRALGGMRAGDLNALDWTAFGEGLTTCVVPRRKTASPQMLDVPISVRRFLERWWDEQGRPAAGPVFPVRRGPRAGSEKKATNMSYAKRLRRELKRALGVQRVVEGRWKDKPEAEWTQRELELFTETETTRPIDFHSCRRAFATALARAGVNAQMAQVLAGHSDASTHQRYVAAATIRALPEAAAPDLSSIDIEKAAAVPFRREGRPRLRRTKVESHRFHDGFLGRGEKIRTSDPLTPR